MTFVPAGINSTKYSTNLMQNSYIKAVPGAWCLVPGAWCLVPGAWLDKVILVKV